MFASLTRFVACLLVQAAQIPPDPDATVRQAIQAVEGDSVTVVAQLWTDRLERDSTDFAALLGLAALAQFTYEYSRADSLYARLYRLAELGLEPWVVTGQIVQSQGLVTRGRLVSADSLLAESIERARALGSPTVEARALIDLARLRARTRGPAASEELLHRAAPLIPPRDLSLKGQYECAGAHVAAFRGDSVAIQQAQRGRILAQEAGDLRLEAQCVGSVGQYLSFRGETGGALEAFAEATALLRRAKDRGALAAALHWRGFVLRTEGRLGEARQEAMWAIREAEASENTVAEAWALLTLAQISAALGDGATGSPHIQRSIALHDQNGDQLGLATALVVEGDLAYAQGQINEAELAYRRGIEWATAFEDPHRLAWSYSKVGNLARHSRDWENAAEALSLSREVASGNGMPGWVRTMTYHFGALALERGQLDDAEFTLATHLSNLNSDENITRYITRARLAEVYARRGWIDRATSELSAAGVDFDMWRSTLSARELRVLVFEYAADEGDPDIGFASTISILTEHGRTDSAFCFVERRRARELLDNLIRVRGLQTTGSHSQVGPDSIVAGASPLTLAEVRAAIPNDETALLEYVTGNGDEPTTLFAVSKAHTAAYRLEPIDVLGGAVSRFTTLVRSGESHEALAVRLGEALVNQAIADLPRGISHLLIAPDGVLHRVPFDALRLADGAWVLERFSVSLVPSASVAVHLWGRRRDPGETHLLAMGDPEYGEAADGGKSADADVLRSAFEETGGLPRLAASAREVRSVARFVENPVVRLRDRASESFLKREPLDRFEILHFATHALVDERALTRTALALSPGDGEDGFVTTAELANLRLDADLVVLSACNTAGGMVVAGEGMEGLTAPLLEAGARAIVASRWPVADESTARFIVDFYRLQSEGLAVGEALRAAKLAALERGEPSASWATFTVVGDPFVRLALEQPRSQTRWLLLGALGLVFVYLVWIKSGRGVAWA